MYKRQLNIEIISPEKVKRGEDITLEAKVTNSGPGVANNVVLTWTLPEGFEIIAGSDSKQCGTLRPRSSCQSSIEVVASYSSLLGKNDIKVSVSYAE